MCRFRHKVFPLIRFPKYAGCQVNFPKKTRYSTGTNGIKDDGEKNLAVYDWFMRRFGAHQECVLSLGCGSGGVAVAAAYYGMSSVSIDDRSSWVLFIKQCIHCVSHLPPPQTFYTRSRLQVLAMAIDDIIHPEEGNRTNSISVIREEGSLFERYDAMESFGTPAGQLMVQGKWNDDSPDKDGPARLCLAGQSPAAAGQEKYWKSPPPSASENDQ